MKYDPHYTGSDDETRAVGCAGCLVLLVLIAALCAVIWLYRKGNGS